MPSSRAACRRIIVIRSSRSPPWPTSTSGIRPKPISSSIGSYERSGTTDSAGLTAGVAVPPLAAAPETVVDPESCPVAAALRRLKRYAPPTSAAIGSVKYVANPKNPKSARSAATMIRTRGCWLSCLMTSSPKLPSAAARETMTAVAVEIKIAGICATIPSPIDRSVKRWADAADDVDEDDDDHRRRIAADELARTVHRTVEVRRPLDVLATLTRLRLGDQAGIQVRVDGELLPRHRIEREARGDFGDAAGAVRDDDELNHGEDHEHDDPHCEVAADHDVPECLDHPSRIAVQQDRAGRRHVERKAEERDDQEQRREDAERERVLDVEGRQHHDECEREVEREQQIEEDGADRDDHQRDQHDRGRSHPEVPGSAKLIQEGTRRRLGAHAIVRFWRR